MKITKKDLEKNQVELTIEVNLDELKPYLEKASIRLSQKSKVPGFRPGKAPYNLLKKQFGEMAIMQEALDEVISKTFFEAITQKKLQTVGQPNINVEKIAPENPLVYKATVSLLPSITLGEWTKLQVAQKKIEVTEEEIKKTIEQLGQMNVKEIIVERKAKQGDKVELDFEVLINKAIIEGGKNSKYPIVIGDSKMIPGFEEKIIDHKAGDAFEFELKFPDKYFQQNLAGKLATFKVKVLNVYEREVPKLDDDYAKTIGFDTLEKLKTQLKENIIKDKEFKEKQRVENEAIQEIVKASTIADLPDPLIDSELHKMMHELEHNIKQQGMDIAGYLKSINKTEEDLKKDFKPQAITRIQAALVLRELSQAEKIEVSDNEIDMEVSKQKEFYKDNKEAIKNISQPNYRQHIANMLTNQKVIKLITDKIIKV